MYKEASAGFLEAITTSDVKKVNYIIHNFIVQSKDTKGRDTRI